jgi:hypothetical protein
VALRARVASGVLVAALTAASAAAADGTAPQRLTGGGEAGAGEFGNSIAVAARGGTMLIGGRNDKSLIGALEGFRVHSQAIGAAWTFVRSGAGWRQQGKKLTARGERGPGGFGNGVALSDDGSTAVVGGPSGYGGVGAAWVFARAGTGWRQEATLVPPGFGAARGYVSDPPGFGASVGLSGDGKTAFVGGPSANGGAGAVWVFARSGSRWTRRARLTGAGESGNGQFGSTIALSADGRIAAVGAPLDGSGVGAVWIFTRKGSSWRPGKKLVGDGEQGYGRFGSAIALSRAGTTLLVGGPVDSNGVGSVWVLAPAGSRWKTVTKLTARDEDGLAQFGDSVALSAAGTTALVGGAFDGNGRGAAWVFRRGGSGWSPQGTKLRAHGASGSFPVQFGASVALTARGDVGMVGAIGNAGGAGAVWVFRL